MNKITRLMLLCGAMAALPALAQETPYQTNMNKSDAQAEARAARGADLTSVTPQQALNNALQRCDPLPTYFKSDCIARVKGQGEGFGSVTGGGILMESKTTLPASQLQAEEKNVGPVMLPRQDYQRPQHQRKHKKAPANQ
ncbi:MAG: hypothetical protein EPN34_12880 [Burkholderiaceae bacterium]|nr:MAG: hypothetical protein EPN34_12880 [Burkholderiaceae bacterium]